MTTPAPKTDLSTAALAALTYREYTGTLALSLSAWGAYPGVTWEELEHAAPCLSEERAWKATDFLNAVLDGLLRRRGDGA